MTSVSANGRVARRFPCTHRGLGSPSAFPRTTKAGAPVPLLDAETEVKLIDRWQQHGDAKALARVVASFQILVSRIAARFRASGLPTEDLVSEGNVGLMHAIAKFDTSRGLRLSTYAMWWIHAAISDYALSSSSLVRGVSTERQKRIFFALRRLKSRLSTLEPQDGKPDYVTTVAEKLGVSRADVADIDTWKEGQSLSINAAPEFEDGAGDEWQDLLVDDAPDPETETLHANEHSRRRLAMHEAMTTLNERELYIVRRRHLAEDPCKLSDIGEHFGITRERVRQIEVRALEKLRRRVREVARQHGAARKGAAAHSPS